MKKYLILLVLIATLAASTSIAQTKVPVNSPVKVQVFYFHPNERCPIDQSIEANAKTVIQSFFSKEINSGVLQFRVLNTEEKANEKVIAKFDINAQALYIVKKEQGKEIQKDLTRFAFDFSKSNPGKFKAELKSEIEKALK